MMVGTQLDIQQIAERAREFNARLKSVMGTVAPRSFEWYPYDRSIAGDSLVSCKMSLKPELVSHTR